VAYLLKSGANIQAVDSSWDSALHWAAYKGSIQVCGLLSFYHKLEWTTQDAYGQTPLHLAALRGHTSIVRYMLVNVNVNDKGNGNGGNTTGAKKRDVLFLKDKNERTPLDLAIHKNRPTVETVLREAMAAAEDPRGHFLRKTLLTNLKDMCSVKMWKSMMGFTLAGQDEMDEPMRFPFYYVCFIFCVHFVFMIAVFAPVANAGKGLLWDKSGWLFWNFVLMLSCWYLFYKTVKTKPGYLDDTHPQIGTWRRLYEETLEAYADETQAQIIEDRVRFLSCCLLLFVLC
jgi:hypothetical protein